MSNTILQGNVAYVNHEKAYVMIEYEINGKKKVINGKVDDKTQEGWIEKKIAKKIHQFHIGDSVRFQSKLTDRGDKMAAVNIQYQYNTSLDALLDKANTENLFTGYLKEAEGKYFIKEIDSYLFFQLPISPWQIKPNEKELNEAVQFKLEHIERKGKVTASLTRTKFIPEWYTAERYQKAGTGITATVYKISPHAIYVNVIGDKIQGKLPFREKVQLNDTIQVKIKYLSATKIIIEAL